MGEEVKKPKKGFSKKQVIVLALIVTVGGSFLWAINWADTEGQMTVWNMISSIEKKLA